MSYLPFRELILCILFCFSFAAHATPALKAGAYVREGGSGTLILEKNTGGHLSFSLSAIGVNAHTCSLEGEIRDGKATMKEAWAEGACTVIFAPQAKGIEVTGKDGETGACRYYCGMRAYFDGLYEMPPAGCAPAEIEQTREEFRHFYDAKKYRDALARLKPVLDNCQTMIHPLYEEGPIRNDLAVTYHKLADYKACRDVLEPYAEDAMLKDEEINEYSYAPSDQGTYLSIISAARVNLRLCNSAEKAAAGKKKQ
ncbi:hypothetical protein LJC19_03655 [Oxalobacter sp. OttesenSCG-928-P03]|nr:hypothetical protein [Oxalobacter sp. OttesenSCG-928-P03]